MHLLPTVVNAFLSASLVRRDGPAETPANAAKPAFPHCQDWLKVMPGMTCNGIIRTAQMYPEEFYRLNPSVGGPEGCDTGKLLAGQSYCVKAKDGHRLHQPAPESEQPPPPPRPEPVPDRVERPTSTAPPEDEKPTDADTPTLVTIPSAPDTCELDGCGTAFLDIKTGHNDNAREHVSMTCGYIFNMHCVHSNLDLPPRLLTGCDSCEKLSSGCPCWFENKYHLPTAAPENDSCRDDNDAFDDGVC